MTKINYASSEWNKLDYKGKLKLWLQNWDGQTPTYDALITNLVNGIKDSGNRVDNGNHTIEFPVPAVFYDHKLEGYRPDYEYETFMFNRLLGELDNEGLVNINTDTQILGTGKDTTNWRPYIVTSVEFSIVDGNHLLDAIDEYKDVISDQVIANLSKTLA